MSADVCACGLHYDTFRTGLTYQDVFAMLWSASDDPTTWRYKRRHTVLGYWRQLKRSMWRAHQDACEEVRRCDQPVLMTVNFPDAAIPVT